MGGLGRRRRRRGRGRDCVQDAESRGRELEVGKSLVNGGNGRYGGWVRVGHFGICVLEKLGLKVGSREFWYDMIDK